MPSPPPPPPTDEKWMIPHFAWAESYKTYWGCKFLGHTAQFFWIHLHTQVPWENCFAVSNQQLPLIYGGAHLSSKGSLIRGFADS